VCYLGVPLSHPCRIDCRCQSPWMWIFHKFVNSFLMFCDRFPLNTCFSGSGASLLQVTLLLVTILLRHFLIINLERQHIRFIYTSRYSFTNWRFHDFRFPPRCDLSNVVGFIWAGARISIRFPFNPLYGKSVCVDDQLCVTRSVIRPI
jgi:hypothetical protein